ncbi:hypothetical protein TI05_11485 [Achromatium sp. WMS3]|nr:hypothetical protein TI05_11485 [Achromatium sp. WMS3]
MTTILLGLLTGLFLLVGYSLGGETGMWIALLFAAASNIFSYWFSDSLVLSAYRAQKIGPNAAPQLHQMVHNLTQQAVMPMPSVYIVNSDAPNAFATGRSPSSAAVAVTTGLMRILKHEELNGVMAHELAHIQNRDTLIGTIVAIMAGAITILAKSARSSSVRRSNYPRSRRGERQEESSGGIIFILLMVVLAPIAALLIRMAISRTREYAADVTGAEISGQPLALANALRKLDAENKRTILHAAESFPSSVHMLIINPLKSFTLGNLFSTHPPITERIRRLEEMHHYGTI